MKALIDDYRCDYGIEPICKVLPIAPSAYYLHAARRANPALRSNRAKHDENLSCQIRRVWEENFQAYNFGVKAKLFHVVQPRLMSKTWRAANGPRRS